MIPLMRFFRKQPLDLQGTIAWAEGLGLAHVQVGNEQTSVLLTFAIAGGGVLRVLLGAPPVELLGEVQALTKQPADPDFVHHVSPIVPYPVPLPRPRPAWWFTLGFGLGGAFVGALMIALLVLNVRH